MITQILIKIGWRISMKYGIGGPYQKVVEHIPVRTCKFNP
jgi:hypothetical protein